MSDFKKLRRTSKKVEYRIPRDYLERMSKKLNINNYIDDSLYPKYNVKRGLRNSNGTGVVVGLTRIGEVYGYDKDENGNKIPREGELFYRGYEVKELVHNYIEESRFGFEEITYLLLFGELPTEKQLAEFNQLLAEKRELPTGFARDAILGTPTTNIMNKLSRAVLELYCYDDDPDGTSIENVLKQSISLIGYFPALIAYAYQSKQSFYDNQSMHLHYPIPELGTAENILRMLRPTGEYTDIEAKVLDLCLILQAEHGGGNNSSFTTHLISSSGTDTYSAISAAIGSLKGPRHGGANISVIRMMQDLRRNVKDITDTKQVDDYLRKVLRGEANDGSGLVYGMGHAIYTLSDPRAVLLKELAEKLAQQKGLMDDFMLVNYIEQRTPALYTEVKGSTSPMCANVDLYSGFVYNALNIPNEVATPFFAMARLSGWCAHRMEELTTGKKLMRPAYINVQPRQVYVPLSQRLDPTVDGPISRETIDALQAEKDSYAEEIQRLRAENIERLRRVQQTSQRIRNLRNKNEALTQTISESTERLQAAEAQEKESLS